jgi:phosphohistidine phosphatase
VSPVRASQNNSFMDLYVLRHGIAEELDEAHPGEDSERRLTVEGAKKMCKIAEGMKEAEVTPDLILTSPYLRARETAEIVATVFHAKKVLELAPELAPHGNPRKLIELLAVAYKKRKSVVLVGHEPYLSSLISLLISGDSSLDIHLKKGGLCKLEIEELTYGRCASLEWLLPPRVMRDLA